MKKLTEAQQRKMIANIHANWPDSICDVCKNNAWSISDVLFEYREYQEGTVLGAGSIVPCAIVTCNICGQIKTFNAISLKLVNRETGKVVDD